MWKTYELSELVAEANSLLKLIPDLADTAEFTERTVYYYVQQGLLPRRSGRRGPGTRYPEHFVYRLLFIRRLQKEESLTLAHIRQTLASVPDETIRAVALGEEPLEVRYSVDDEELAKRRARNEQILQLRGEESFAASIESKIPQRPSKADKAMDKKIPGEQRLSLGPGVELVVTKSITAKQIQQLRTLSPLVQSILESDKGSGEE